AIKQSSREAAMKGAGRGYGGACRHKREDDATTFGLDHVIPQGLGDRVERQSSGSKALDELQPANLLTRFDTNRPVGPRRHWIAPSRLAAALLGPFFRNAEGGRP